VDSLGLSRGSHIHIYIYIILVVNLKKGNIKGSIDFRETTTCAFKIKNPLDRSHSYLQYDAKILQLPSILIWGITYIAGGN
jgi:hypothetical protein